MDWMLTYAIGFMVCAALVIVAVVMWMWWKGDGSE